MLSHGKLVETWSLIMGSNPFDVMIDDWSFEIAHLYPTERD